MKQKPQTVICLTETKTEMKDKAKSGAVEKTHGTEVEEALKREFGDILFVEEKLFGGVAVFLHSDVAKFLKLIDSVYEKPPVDKFPLNNGTFLSGVGKFNKSTRVYLVWANRAMQPDALSALPSFAHEISHLIDTILEKANVNDVHGETRAYLTDMYLTTVMKWLGLIDRSVIRSGDAGKLEESILEEMKVLRKENYEQVEKSVSNGKQGK